MWIHFESPRFYGWIIEKQGCTRNSWRAENANTFRVTAVVDRRGSRGPEHLSSQSKRKFTVNHVPRRGTLFQFAESNESAFAL